MLAIGNKWKNWKIWALILFFVLLISSFLYFIFLGIQASLASIFAAKIPIPTMGINQISWESIFISVAVVLLALFFALLPLVLVFSFFLGGRRDRVKGDIWADLGRLHLRKFLVSSAEFNFLIQQGRHPGRTQTNPSQPKNKLVDKVELAQIFDRRFNDFYGPGVYLLPVLTYTFICFIGWMIIFFPNAITGGDAVRINNADFYGFAAMIQGGIVSYITKMSQAGSIFSFAFLGAYFWSLQILIRRYSSSDLKPVLYFRGTIQVVAALIAAFLFLVALPDEWLSVLAKWGVPAFGFFLGVFTLPIVQSLWEYLQNKKLPGFSNANFGSPNDLTNLGGVNVFISDRLGEESVESIDGLTTVNLVDLLIHTRFPTEMVIDWIDRALLYRHSLEGGNYTKLKSMGILSATDLFDVWNNQDDEKYLTRGELTKYLEGQNVPEPQLKGIVTSLRRSPNFQYIAHYWQDLTENESHYRIDQKVARSPQPVAFETIGPSI